MHRARRPHCPPCPRASLALAVLLAAAALPRPAGAQEHATELWYGEPAARWEEALPIGNGRLGAMAHGGIGEELLQLNEDTIWAGAPFARDRAGAYRFLAEARRLSFEGHVAEAQTLMQREFMTERIVRGYQPLGDLRLAFAGLGDDGVRDYRRSLDLDTAIAHTTFRAGGALHRREVFASPVADLIVVRLECDRPGGVSFDLTLGRERGAAMRYAPDGTATMTGRAFHPTGEGAGATAPRDGVRFECEARILHAGGAVAVAADGRALTLRGADRATVLLSAGTDYRIRPGAPIDARARAASRVPADFDYAELRAAHVAEHRRLYRRVALDLGGHDARARPTDARLRAVRDGGADPDLAALYFQLGRYLLISSSRPGTMPANLQGIWNPHLEPPWNCDYHININVQMNYWPAEVCNLAECHEPFFDLIDGIRARGRKTARELYDCPGFVAHHTTDAWWFTSPIGRTVWGLWPTGGAWCTRHGWEHYLFGGDLEFLAGRAWPAMREAAEFFLAYLAEDPATGLLVSGPSSSPENRYRTADGQVADVGMGASMDQQIVWDLFTNVIEAAGELALPADDAFVRRVRTARDRLAPPQVGSDGRLLEWSREYEEPEPGHRHMSHLFGLHPGRQLTQGRAPELVAAARKSLDHRLAHGGGHTGWSRAWMINFFARLGDGEQAHDSVVLLLGKSTLPNLFDDHPPFQIDGNFGGAAGIAEMLLQSHDGEIALLPALPRAWRDGEVSGLRARGGFTVDIAWRGGELREARLRSDRARQARVRLGEKSAQIELAAGGVVVLGVKDFR